MADLSVLIPARQEEFLKNTVEDVLAHAKGDTDVIVVLDGAWADPPLVQHPNVQVVHVPEAIGQRAATNLAARISTAKYICKLDAHCSVDDGFDVKLMEAGEALGHDVTQIPRQYNLHIWNWKCLGCGTETYQGPTPTDCKACVAKSTQGGPFERVIYWDRNAGGVPGKHVRSDFWCVDEDLHFQYDHGYSKRPEAKGLIVDVMSNLGACFFMRRERFHEIGGLDEAIGSWGQCGQEVAFKSWLSGGRHVTNKNTWFAHFFRVGGIGFPYPIKGSDQDKARVYSRDLWLRNGWSGQVRPVSWLIEKFAPAPGWSSDAVARVTVAGAVFSNSRLVADGALTHQFARREDDLRRRQEVAVQAMGGFSLGVATSIQVDAMSDQFQVGGVAASGVSTEVIKHQDPAHRYSLNEPRVHEAVAGNGPLAQARQRDLAVAVAVKGGIPDPALTGRVDGDLGEDSGEFDTGETGNGKIFGSHASASSADVRLESASRDQRGVGSPFIISKSVCYYSDNKPVSAILDACKAQLVKVANGLPIVSVTLKPTDLGLNIVLPLERGYLTMARQILIALEMSSADVVFFCEHDCLYHPSHFQFTPERDDTFYYNQHTVKVDAKSGHALFYLCNQLSGLCAYRSALLEHFRARVARMEKDGFTRSMGFEPGTRKIRHGGIDDRPYASWMSAAPNVDIRHADNLTASRWKQSDFRNQKYCQGWRESDHVEGWPGITEGRFTEWLREVTSPPATEHGI